MITWKAEDLSLDNEYGRCTAEQWRDITQDIVKEYVKTEGQALLPIYPKHTDLSGLEKAENMKDIMLAVSGILDIEFKGYDDQPYIDTQKIRNQKECQRKIDSEYEDLMTAYNAYKGGRAEVFYNYLSENCGEEYRVDRLLRYESCSITLQTGGPAVYLDTGNNTLKLRWWGSCEDIGVPSEVCDLVDEIMEEAYERRKSGC